MPIKRYPACMVKNYFMTGWRNLLRDKGNSIINISGLAIGMAVAMMIGLWVFDELSFNKSFDHYSRIGRVYHHLNFGGNIFTTDDVPHPLGQELKNHFGDFEEVSMTEQGDHMIGYEEKAISKPCLFIEPSFAAIFSLRTLQGSATSLKDIHSVMISRTLMH